MHAVYIHCTDCSNWVTLFYRASHTRVHSAVHAADWCSKVNRTVCLSCADNVSDMAERIHKVTDTLAGSRI